MDETSRMFPDGTFPLASRCFTESAFIVGESSVSASLAGKDVACLSLSAAGKGDSTKDQKDETKEMKDDKRHGSEGNMEPSKDTKDKQVDDLEELESDSEEGGKVDIPEYREDISDGDVEDKNAEEIGLMDMWMVESSKEGLVDNDQSGNLIPFVEMGMSGEECKNQLVEMSPVPPSPYFVPTNTPDLRLLEIRLKEETTRCLDLLRARLQYLIRAEDAQNLTHHREA
ncbi:hypothetical protein GUJ93_ZPchr0004g38619 [Zizania palustris]|uniref:Uncharacterized protein n=1 Tax=Zizania palustris TaxID=103762 RepID=A0A8J5S006_ZIZPA|nr:hypothetical protein GUJ93_ZPchr0004g38619 [Zizania palustris]